MFPTEWCTAGATVTQAAAYPTPLPRSSRMYGLSHPNLGPKILPSWKEKIFYLWSLPGCLPRYFEQMADMNRFSMLNALGANSCPRVEAWKYTHPLLDVTTPSQPCPLLQSRTPF